MRTPILRKEFFNVTRADPCRRIVENEEIYNMIDTEEIFKPAGTGICIKHFGISRHCTLDEYLLSFRGERAVDKNSEVRFIL